MKQFNLLKLVITLCLGLGLSVGWAQVTTFTYTGAPETYVVPASVTMISIEASGAQGGDGNGGAGGLGATMYGEFTVSPGDNLEVIVGEAGMQYGNSGGGGGGSGVVFMGAPMIVAGGGGGGSIYDPGFGGVITEAGGSSSGAGGTGGMGGQKGYRSGDCGWAAGGGGFYGDGYGGDGDWDGGPLPGTLGGAGAGASYASGGAGGVNGGCTFTFPNEGAYGCGGGGAGSYGGAGGGGYSGGGGGQYVDPGGASNRPGGGGGSFNDGTAQVNTPGNHSGNGEIIITVLCNALTVTVSDYEICLGDELTLDAESDGGFDITWDGGATDGVAFTPDETGVVTYTATSDGPDDCPYSVDITIHELPIVNAGSGDENYCLGETVVLSASGSATSWFWDDPLVLDPGLGTHTYTLMGIDDNGCSATDAVTITVHDLPTVTASVDHEDICEGQMVTVTGGGADTYVWDAGVIDGEAFVPGPVGSYTYTVTGTDENDCENTASVDVTVVEGISISYAITDEIAGGDAEINITVSGGVPAYSFDWDNDGTGDFDDTEDLTGLTAGEYVVVVEGSTGCSATATIEVGSQVGVEELTGAQILVYPNPTTSDVTIEFEGTFNYELSAINGEIILHGTAVDKEMIDLNELSNGVYFVTIKANDAVSTIKLVKK